MSKTRKRAVKRTDISKLSDSSQYYRKKRKKERLLSQSFASLLEKLKGKISSVAGKLRAKARRDKKEVRRAVIGEEEIRQLKRTETRNTAVFSAVVVICALILIGSALLFSSGILNRKTRLSINDAGRVIEVETDRRFVKEILKDNHIEITAPDILVTAPEEAVTEGMVIEIKRAFPVVINRGRNRTVIYMVAGTVRDALDIAGIELKDVDQVFPSLNEFISGGSEITLIITEKKYETEYVKIPFGTKYIKHKKGNKTEAEESEGMAGIEKITYLVTYVNDVPTEKKIVQRETIIEPIDEIRYK